MSPQISSIVCPVRLNLNPSEVLVRLCFPLSDCFLAIDVSLAFSLFSFGLLGHIALIPYLCVSPRPFLCILVDVLFYSNTHPRMYLFCIIIISAILVFIHLD